MEGGKIKIARVSTYYIAALENFVAQNPGLNDLSYSARYRLLMDECFAQADFWKINLEATGKFEVEEIVINAEFLQKKWAEENKISYNESDWLNKILYAQLQNYQPDILVVFDLKHIDAAFKNKIRKACSTLRLIISWDGALLHDVEKMGGSDVILSCVPETVSFYKKKGFNSFLFSHCFEPSVLDKIEKRKPLYDVSFIGSLFLNNEAHYSRYRDIQKLRKEINCDLWLSSLTSPFKNFCINSFHLFKNAMINDFIQMLAISRINRGAVFGRDMYQVLSDSKTSLNFMIPGTISFGTNTGSNMRLFEAAGVGTCLITDRKDIVQHYFEPEKEVVTFDSIDECVEKVNYLLQHAEERMKIEKAGQLRVLKDHTYQHRLKKLIPEILELM